MIRLLPVLFAFIPSLAVAGDFARVSGRDSFVALVSGHEPAVPLFGISLSVGASGQITGKAQGAEVTGEWTWKDDLFCRTMRWSDTDLPPNCQTVEVQDGTRVRFTADEGQGKSAVFVLR